MSLNNADHHSGVDRLTGTDRETGPDDSVGAATGGLGPTTALDRLARARCLVPLLGHVAVRLASLQPVLAALGEVRRRSNIEAPESATHEDLLAAAEEVITQADGVACFVSDLTELCSAEGQWLAALALGPKVAQKLVDDFAKLAGALEGVASHAGGSGRVAMQPAAAGGSAKSSAPLASERGGPFEDAGRAAALHAMLCTAMADLRTDLEHGGPGRGRLAPELAVAHELQCRLLGLAPSAEGGGGLERSGEADQELLERIAGIGGAGRPLPVLRREFEAAEQFCRVLACAAPPTPSAQRSGGEGAGTIEEPVTPAFARGGRDALVSETQASSGSALHRWIRAQVTDPHLSAESGSGVAGAGGGASAGTGEGDESPPPHEFLCPIAQDVMRDAVSTCDGHTYERRNIEAWLSEKSTSPITGLPLANKTLIPNHNLRKLIRDSGVLSRLGLDAKPDEEVAQFRERVCCEVVVPRDAATLSEALDLGLARAAPFVLPPGARAPLFGIRLLRGEHAVARTLRIEQDVEIIGEGATGTVLRLAADATLEPRGHVRIAHLALCRDAACAAAAEPYQLPARSVGVRALALVEIAQGSCRIEQCDLSNAVGSAVRVSGAHTSPTISGNTIHGCRDPSVVFQDGADGTLAANRLFGNHSVAIEVHSRADPLIEDNDVFGGRQGGIFIYNRGKGHLRRNKIFQNALEGVEIKQGGRPLVEDNDIYDNLECGIFVHSGGEGRIIGNRIHSNSYAGIEIKDASSPEVRGNDVYSGRTSGMYVHSGGQGVIEGNQIHQNLLHGVYVRNRGCPHLLKNCVFRNEECGIFVTESSHPSVEHNEVYSNGLAGIEVKEDSNPTIKLNRIHDGNTGGIFVLSRGRGRIFENKLYKNRLEGVEIKDGGDPQIVDNEIYENLECGIFAHDGALGRIEGNRIFANAYAGVEIKDQSRPIVKDNQIYRGHTSGIYVHSGGQGKVIENEIFENGLHGVMILSGGHPIMTRNRVHDNAECGVVSHVGYALDSVSNQIYSNRVKNIQTVRS